PHQIIGASPNLRVLGEDIGSTSTQPAKHAKAGSPAGRLTHGVDPRAALCLDTHLLEVGLPGTRPELPTGIHVGSKSLPLNIVKNHVNRSACNPRLPSGDKGCSFGPAGLKVLLENGPCSCLCFLLLLLIDELGL